MGLGCTNQLTQYLPSAPRLTSHHPTAAYGVRIRYSRISPTSSVWFSLLGQLPEMVSAIFYFALTTFPLLGPRFQLGQGLTFSEYMFHRLSSVTALTFTPFLILRCEVRSQPVGSHHIWVMESHPKEVPCLS